MPLNVIREKCTSLQDHALRSACEDIFGLKPMAQQINGTVQSSKRRRIVPSNRLLEQIDANAHPLPKLFSILGSSASLGIEALCPAAKWDTF